MFINPRIKFYKVNYKHDAAMEKKQLRDYNVRLNDLEEQKRAGKLKTWHDMQDAERVAILRSLYIKVGLHDEDIAHLLETDAKEITTYRRKQGLTLFK